MTNISDILKAGRAKLEQGFTQGTLGRDATGSPCLPSSCEAVSWCSLGALICVSPYDLPAEFAAAEQLLTEAIDDRQLILWNDTHTKDEVLAGWDKAIALAEAEEGAKHV